MVWAEQSSSSAVLGSLGRGYIFPPTALNPIVAGRHLSTVTFLPSSNDNKDERNSLPFLLSGGKYEDPHVVPYQIVGSDRKCLEQWSDLAVLCRQLVEVQKDVKEAAFSNKMVPRDLFLMAESPGHPPPSQDYSNSHGLIHRKSSSPICWYIMSQRSDCVGHAVHVLEQLSS